jgi:hypothetical protein
MPFPRTWTLVFPESAADGGRWLAKSIKGIQFYADVLSYRSNLGLSALTSPISQDLPRLSLCLHLVQIV